MNQDLTEGFSFFHFIRGYREEPDMRRLCPFHASEINESGECTHCVAEEARCARLVEQAQKESYERGYADGKEGRQSIYQDPDSLCRWHNR